MKFLIIAYISLLIQGIVVFMGGFYYRSLPRQMRLLTLLLVFIFIATIISHALAFLGVRNHWLSHISTIIEFTLLIFIFYSWIKYRRIQFILFICLTAFIVFWIISKFTFEPFTQIDGWTAAISKILLIIFSLFLLVEVIKENDIVWTNDPRFWIAAGVIIYSAGSMFMFALFNMMLQISPERLMLVWPLNWVLVIISNLFYARGFLCKR